MNAKQKRTLGLLVAIVAVLVIVLIAVKLINRHNSENSAADASSSAGEVTAADLAYTKLTYNNGTATLSFSVDDSGAWYWVDDPEFPLDGDYLTKIVNTISGLKPQQTITDGDTLEAYGLDQPSMTLTATASDGTETTFALGNQVVSDTECYYLMINNDKSTVYVVTDSLHSELSNGIYAMMALPELPVLTEDQITSVDVTGAVETTLTSYLDSSASNAASSASSSAESTPSVTWSSAGSDVTGTDNVTNLVAEASVLTLTSCQDFKPSSKAVSLCGFDAPKATVTVNYTDDQGAEQILTLTIANAMTDGSNCYVRVNDDTTIYAMSADSLSTILSVAASGLSA